MTSQKTSNENKLKLILSLLQLFLFNPFIFHCCNKIQKLKKIGYSKTRLKGSRIRSKFFAYSFKLV
ncbi:hypothetical protein BpHYR1_046505 [Brachionus plicatilis]|uniref:Uncharacterized protein n=1 Tax=Brachionus plicatilis TaxID=10195 RepID=A0A3M7QQJ3_BRAPC|nr:hypothetical protein BpHYR1_046505 [Brachionus plicatilis]